MFICELCTILQNLLLAFCTIKYSPTLLHRQIKFLSNIISTKFSHHILIQCTVAIVLTVMSQCRPIPSKCLMRHRCRQPLRLVFTAVSTKPQQQDFKDFVFMKIHSNINNSNYLIFTFSYLKYILKYILYNYKYTHRESIISDICSISNC